MRDDNRATCERNTGRRHRNRTPYDREKPRARHLRGTGGGETHHTSTTKADHRIVHHGGSRPQPPWFPPHVPGAGHLQPSPPLPVVPPAEVTSRETATSRGRIPEEGTQVPRQSCGHVTLRSLPHPFPVWPSAPLTSVDLSPTPNQVILTLAPFRPLPVPHLVHFIRCLRINPQ